MTFQELAELVKGKTCPLDAENENGELVIIAAGRADGERFFKVTTFQKNGWQRINYIWENGTREELFEKEKAQ